MIANIFNIKKVSAVIAVLVLYTAFSVTLAQAAATEKITTIGQSAIIDGNTVVAREKAIKNAMKKAVESAVKRLASSATILDNFQVIKEKIYSKSNSYIKSFNVTSVTDEVTLFIVTIDAEVRFDDIKKDLIAANILSVKKDLPKFIMFVAEKDVDSEGYKFWWGKEKAVPPVLTVENEISMRFTEQGFASVDRSAALKKSRVNPDYDSDDLKDSSATDLIRQTSAEIIIIGKALATVLGTIDGSEMKSVLGTINARVIDRTGKVISLESASAKILHVNAKVGGDEALKKASSILADKLIEAVKSEFGAEATESQLITLKLSGLTYKRFRDFVDILKHDIRGVSNITQESFTSGGVAKMTVQVKGGAEFLTKELLKRDFPSLDTQVISTTSSLIEITIKSKFNPDDLRSISDDEEQKTE